MIGSLMVGLFGSMQLQRTALQPNSLSLLFSTPLLHVNLLPALPKDTMEALETAVMASWSEHIAEQAQLPNARHCRATDDDATRLRASSNAELNEEARAALSCCSPCR